MKKINLILLALSIFIVWPQWSYAESIQCPATLTVTESAVAQAGWSDYKQSVAKTLHAATLYAGNLGDTSSALAPEEKQKGNQLIQLWDLSTYGSSKENIWLECKYLDSGIAISRVLPHTIKKCSSTMRLDKNHNAQMVSSIVCE